MTTIEVFGIKKMGLELSVTDGVGKLDVQVR